MPSYKIKHNWPEVLEIQIDLLFLLVLSLLVN